MKLELPAPSRHEAKDISLYAFNKPDTFFVLMTLICDCHSCALMLKGFVDVYQSFSHEVHMLASKAC